MVKTVIKLVRAKKFCSHLKSIGIEILHTSGNILPFVISLTNAVFSESAAERLENRHRTESNTKKKMPRIK